MLPPQAPGPDPHVILQGTANCGVPGATWVYVHASDGEQGWATNGTGHYYFNLWHVPTGGLSVHVTYGEAGFSCHDDFGVARPAIGNYATRNLAHIWPNG